MSERVKKRRRRKHWSRSFGKRGSRVRVVQRANGIIYGEIRGRRVSLGHRVRARAEAWAKQQEAELIIGENALADPDAYRHPHLQPVPHLPDTQEEVPGLTAARRAMRRDVGAVPGAAEGPVQAHPA